MRRSFSGVGGILLNGEFLGYKVATFSIGFVLFRPIDIHYLVENGGDVKSATCGQKNVRGDDATAAQCYATIT